MAQMCRTQNFIVVPKLFFLVWILMIAVTCIPGRLEAAPSKTKSTGVMVFAHAKIQKGIEVRSSSGAKPTEDKEFPAANISIRECDVEALKQAKNCIFIIYEMQ
jgi:hypothetical protein